MPGAIGEAGWNDLGEVTMGTVLHFTPASRNDRGAGDRDRACEIVIFPGVRIERHDVDLGHRLRNTAGSERFNSLGGNGRPRKTS